MTRHLLKWISGFKMVAWCSPSDDFMSPALVGSSAVKSPPDTLVVEPKLCDCEPCLAAIRALSPPATDGGAKKITDLAKNNRPEELLPATVVPSERAAAQACAFCDAPLDLCSCGGMAP